MTQYPSRHLDDRELRQRWVDPRLYSVRVADIRAYLQAKGWQLIPADRSDVLIFQEPGLSAEGPLYQCVPASERDRDYPARVYELIAAVAAVEDRYAGDVLTDMLRATAPAAAPNGAVEALGR